MNSSKSSIVRAFSLFSLIPSSSTHGKTTADLYQLMLDLGYDISKRTLERDLRKLEEMGLICCQQEAEGNHWKHLKKSSPAELLIAPNEALSYLASQGILKKLLPKSVLTHFNPSLNYANNILTHSNRYQDWQDKIFTQLEVGMDSLSYNEDLYEMLLDCVFKKNQIELTYCPYGHPQAKKYQLNPYGIIIRSHYIYLVATKKELPDEYRIFSLHRMQKIESLYTPLMPPPTETLKQYVSRGTARGLLEQKFYKIKLYVRDYSYEWAQYNSLSKAQQISEPDEDGWASIEFEDYLTYELLGWILKQRDDVIVESPQALKNHLIESLQNTLSYYQ